MPKNNISTIPTLPADPDHNWSVQSERFVAWALLHEEEFQLLPRVSAEVHGNVKPVIQAMNSWTGNGSLLDHVAETAPNEAAHAFDLMANSRPISADGDHLLAVMRKAWAEVEVKRSLPTGNLDLIKTAIDRLKEAETASSCGWLAGIAPASVQAGRFLSEDPPPLHWIFKNSLLAGTVGFLVGAPGVGKSTFAISLALSQATGQNLTGQLDPAGFGSVLAIFSEEDEAVLHRRMKTIASRLEVSKSACDRVYSVAAAGKDLRLVQAGKNGEVEPTQAFRDLRTLARKIPNLRLIILDPLSRLYGLPENDNTGPTVFISMLEALAQETGAAVMVSHHTRKAGKDGTYKTALDAESLRGASAFTGAIRWQMNITTMSKEEARKVIGVGSPAQGQFLAARVCKKNYGPPEDEFFLERGDGGVLRPCIPSAEIAQRDKVEILKEKIVETIGQLDDQGKGVTKKQLGDVWPAKWKAEGLADVTKTLVRSVVDMMLMDGELEEVEKMSPNGRNVAVYLGVSPRT